MMWTENNMNCPDVIALQVTPIVYCRSEQNTNDPEHRLDETAIAVLSLFQITVDDVS